ncbi:uncharacterized protein LOC127803946 isoform X2 [Diospyros lotus]|uniref:uncharacterized protein LOC127803946 isoform X2 n=1 Tax=Diospyros lotus TaxID=55363 RepID=UPI002252F960|nr:uncharacterized protein LOC127803946 isoform X2 [Diospyros lotus]
MSILPSKDLRSAPSSSSQPPIQNPNFNHGIAHQQPNSHPQLQLAQSPPNHVQSFQYLQISDPTYKISGTVSQDADNSCGSSKKVNGSGKRSGKKLVANQANGRNSHFVQGGIGSAQESEKPSETVVSPRSQGGSGSMNFQASTTHLTGRKTQMVNGNHLLNFHYDPIPRPQPRSPAPRRLQKRKPYNKDLFLQANYKFVVLDSRNYSPRLLDPDKMLSWEDIICVKFSTPFPVQCPICLDDPLCPQITSCGHIFCFPCILRYFSIGEDDYKDECWKKCPLCFMLISSKDLYTIYIENVKRYCVGETAEFLLLTRQKDSFSLYLKNKQGMDAKEEAPNPFSKFTFTSDIDVSVKKAISDLDSWLARADSGLVDDLEKLPYVCAAMEQLELRRKNWNAQQVDHGNMACKHNDSQMELQGSQSAADHLNAGNEPCSFVWRSFPASGNGKSVLEGDATPEKLDAEFSRDQHVDVVGQFFDLEATLSSSYDDKKSMQRNFHGFRVRKEKDSFNFYQAVDGQHLILHPLNMKCLLNHYGGYDMLPHRISGKILQLETVTQSEAMRRRYRFLSHFSLTTTFQLCEIDLSDLLPPDALSPFMDEIKNREKQRKRLARKVVIASGAIEYIKANLRAPGHAYSCSSSKWE